MTWQEIINRILHSTIPPSEMGNVATPMIAAAIKASAWHFVPKEV